MDVKKTLTDSGYIVVGLGVLGAEQANSARQDLAAKVSSQVAPARDRAAARSAATRTKVRSGLDESRRRANATANRVNDTAERVGHRLSERAKRAGTEAGRSADKASEATRELLVRVDQLLDELRDQLEPVIGRLPEPAQRANEQWADIVDRGRARVLQLAGVSDAATSEAA